MMPITTAWIAARCHEDADCLIWDLMCEKGCGPRSRLSTNGKAVSFYVRYSAWRAYGGRQLKDGEVMTTTCGNPRCLAKEHLAVTTQAAVLRRTCENAGVKLRKDAKAAAAVRARQKLSFEAADEIRANGGRIVDIAAKYGVSQQTAYLVREGRRWVRPAQHFNGLGAR
jgi:hypothetical protein